MKTLLQKHLPLLVLALSISSCSEDFDRYLGKGSIPEQGAAKSEAKKSEHAGSEKDSKASSDKSASAKPSSEDREDKTSDKSEVKVEENSDHASTESTHKKSKSTKNKSAEDKSHEDRSLKDKANGSKKHASSKVSKSEASGETESDKKHESVDISKNVEDTDKDEEDNEGWTTYESKRPPVANKSSKKTDGALAKAADQKEEDAREISAKETAKEHAHKKEATKHESAKSELAKEAVKKEAEVVHKETVAHKETKERLKEEVTKEVKEEVKAAKEVIKREITTLKTYAHELKHGKKRVSRSSKDSFEDEFPESKSETIFIVDDTGLSLSIISTMVFGTSRKWKKIAEWNHIEAPYRIRMGQRLVIQDNVTVSRSEMNARLLNLWRRHLEHRKVVEIAAQPTYGKVKVSFQTLESTVHTSTSEKSEGHPAAKLVNEKGAGEKQAEPKHEEVKAAAVSNSTVASHAASASHGNEEHTLDRKVQSETKLPESHESHDSHDSHDSHQAKDKISPAGKVDANPIAKESPKQETTHHEATHTEVQVEKIHGTPVSDFHGVSEPTHPKAAH